jgi:hypothetical protein
MSSYTVLGVIIGITLLTTLGATLIQQIYATATTQTFEQKRKAAKAIEDGAQITTQTFEQRKAAPIATSGDNNVYIAWWSNKTGNDEVMFKASTDAGKTFSDKMNLSNTINSQSQNASIAAGSNVYVSWWERNQTSNEPVLRVSNDNAKTFGEKIMLSEK